MEAPLGWYPAMVKVWEWSAVVMLKVSWSEVKVEAALMASSKARLS
jgi:hypothetical protein